MDDLHVVPSLFVMGVAPDGAQYRLDIIFGEWLHTISDEQNDTIMKSGTLNRKQVKELWDYIGHTDRPPTELKIALKPNPEYGKWVSMGMACQIITEKLIARGHAQPEGLRGLHAALASGKIRSRGILMEEKGDVVGAKEIEFDAGDVIKWLELEYEVRISRDELMGSDGFFKMFGEPLDGDVPGGIL